MLTKLTKHNYNNDIREEKVIFLVVVERSIKTKIQKFIILNKRIFDFDATK